MFLPPPPPQTRVLGLACPREVIIGILVLLFRDIEVDAKCVLFINVRKRKKFFAALVKGV